MFRRSVPFHLLFVVVVVACGPAAHAEDATPAPALTPTAVAGAAGPVAAGPLPPIAASPAPSLDQPAVTPSAAPSLTPTARPAATPSPSPTPTPVLDPPPRAGKFTLDLHRPGAFVPQFDEVSCVASAMQTMINLMTPGRPDRTRATQKKLYDWAREISPWIERGPGASIQGWTGALEQLGLGDFAELAFETRAEALRTAARQMRMTGKPVGLWVWHGEHAWVISGFKSTADPAFTDEFRVTAVWIEDPWSGRVSRIWGKGLKPHTLLTADGLTAGFTRFSSRHRPQYGPEGLYTIIAPIA